MNVEGKSKLLMWSDRESDQCVALYNIFNFTTHTLGSNSTATLGQSVVELITFGALSWSIIVLGTIIAAFFCCVSRRKQSIKDMY